MRTDGYKQIEELLERFFEGQTSNAEERLLYDFFARTDVPAHLESYREVFRFLEKGIAGEFQEAPELRIPVREHSRGKRKLTWIVAFCAAASLALLLVYIYPISTGDERGFNPYEGSYIVRNGKRITDWNEIQGEVEVTRLAALEKQRQAECLLRKVDDMEFVSKTKDRLLEERCHLILRGIHDETSRRIASDILKQEQ